eukprot:ctg_478.g246
MCASPAHRTGGRAADLLSTATTGGDAARRQHRAGGRVGSGARRDHPLHVAHESGAALGATDRYCHRRGGRGAAGGGCLLRPTRLPLPVGPRRQGLLPDRRQRGHPCERLALLAVRLVARARHRHGGGAGRRHGAGSGAGTGTAQGQHRLRPEAVVYRLGGHAGRGHQSERGVRSGAGRGAHGAAGAAARFQRGVGAVAARATPAGRDSVRAGVYGSGGGDALRKTAVGRERRQSVGASAGLRLLRVAGDRRRCSGTRPRSAGVVSGASHGRRSGAGRSARTGSVTVGGAVADARGPVGGGVARRLDDFQVRSVVAAQHLLSSGGTDATATTNHGRCGASGQLGPSGRRQRASERGGAHMRPPAAGGAGAVGVRVGGTARRLRSGHREDAGAEADAGPVRHSEPLQAVRCIESRRGGENRKRDVMEMRGVTGAVWPRPSLGDAVPAELLSRLSAALLAEEAGVLEVLEALADAPGDRAGLGVDLVPLAIVGDKLARAAILGDHHRLFARPRLQHHDPERFVAAGHAHHVARLEELHQGRAAHGAGPAERIGGADLATARLERALQIAVADHDELDIAARLEDEWRGLHQQIGPFLNGHTADEEHHRVQRADLVAGAHLGRVPQAAVVAQRVDAVVHAAQLVPVEGVDSLDLVAQHTADADDAVSGGYGGLLDVADARRLSAVMLVAAAAVLSGVYREDARTAPHAVLGVGERRTGQPVVAVDDIEAGVHKALHFVQGVHERVAHVLAFDHKVRRAVKAAAVHVHPVDALVRRLTHAGAHEQVHLVAAALQPGRQFGDMRRHTADGHRVERLPGEEGDFVRAWAARHAADVLGGDEVGHRWAIRSEHCRGVVGRGAGGGIG